jgi:hypothetical protein
MMDLSLNPAKQRFQTGVAEPTLLEWFALKIRAPVVVSRVELGTISYHRAMAVHQSDMAPFVSTGRGQTQAEAVTKAVSEFIERKVFLDHSHMSSSVRGSCRITTEGELSTSQSFRPFPEAPPCARTSSGWAVHPLAECAVKNALMELIERHCLVLSYLKNSWCGFNLINETIVEGVRFLSCIATTRVGGVGAGVIIGIVPSTGGIGIGHMADQVTGLATSSKWKQAFFESYDNIELFDPAKTFPPESIEAISQEYLTQPFTNEADLLELLPFVDQELGEVFFELYDLKTELGCPTPLFAASVISTDLMPLFFPNRLDAVGRRWVKGRLKIFGDLELPNRMPII